MGTEFQYCWGSMDSVGGSHRPTVPLQNEEKGVFWDTRPLAGSKDKILYPREFLSLSFVARV